MKKTNFFPAIALLTLMVSTFIPMPSASGGQVAEYDVKAAYLVNFGRFVTWPDGASDSALTVGVLGDDPFGDTLDKVVTGKTVDGRSFKVKRFDHFDQEQVGQLRKCQILFIAYSEKDLASTIVKALQGSGTLTVAEFDNFPVVGGMITFDQVGQKIGLILNPGAAERSGLKFRAQLMQVAKIYKK